MVNLSATAESDWQRYEHEALSHPQRYRRKVVALAVLGNAYVGAIVTLIGSLLLALVTAIVLLKAWLALKVALGVGVFLWALLKAVWIRIPAPSGLALKPASAPALFSLIHELRVSMRAPAFHRVLITDQFNAGVSQVPRLGIFGWHSHYLQIGLPLMANLTRDQLKAVLAHEMAHTAGGDGRMSNWVYCQRLRWEQLLQALKDREGMASSLFVPFLRWFTPLFNAYSYPLARANEFQADRTAAALTDRGALAEALTCADVIGGPVHTRHWSAIHEQAADLAKPEVRPYRQILQSGYGSSWPHDAEQLMKQAISQPTRGQDTHPSLRDRLNAIDQPPGLNPPSAQQRATALLGEAAEEVADVLDQRWSQSIEAWWVAHHEQIVQSRSRLAELDAQAALGEELAVEDGLERALLTDSIARKPDEALDQLRALSLRDPSSHAVCFELGARLLERDDPQGRQWLERAMDGAPGYVEAACTALRDHYARHGDNDGADAWHQRLVDHLQAVAAARRERNQVSAADEFRPHELSPQVLAQVQDALKDIPGLYRAYLVQKGLAHFPEVKCYILAFRVSRWYQVYTATRAQEVLGNIQAVVPFPGETIIVNVDGPSSRIETSIRKVPGAQVLGTD